MFLNSEMISNPSVLTQFAMLLPILMCFAILEVVLKAFALWKAIKNNNKAWFVCIFIFNTMGILPAIYLLLNKNKK